MRCPNCNGGDCKIIDSRTRPDGKKRRRYECNNCDSRFSTVELPVDELKKLLDYIKHDTLIRDTVSSLNEMLSRLK